MTRERSPEDARYWLREAEKRLEHARGYVPDNDTRILCEQAHYAAEFAIKAVIIAHGRNFATTHDIEGLLETARDAGETIPSEVEKATGLSTYAGAGRYEFEREPDRVWVNKSEYDRALNAGSATVEWGRGRIERILGERDKAE